MFGSFGMMEILLILIVGVVVFGAIRLPRLARSISSGWHELKRLKRGFDLGFDERGEHHTQGHGSAQNNQPYYNGNSGPQGYTQEQQPYQAGGQYYEQEPPSAPPQDDSTEKSENNDKNT